MQHELHILELPHLSELEMDSFVNNTIVSLKDVYHGLIMSIF